MKSEHRHELKENELAEWVAGFPQWLKHHQKTIIYVSVFVILIGGYWLWYRYQKNVIAVRQEAEFSAIFGQLSRMKQNTVEGISQGQDLSANLTSIAEQFAQAAQSARTPQNGALALIEQADIIRMQLHYMFRTPDAQTKTTQLNKAKDIYNQALAKLDTDGPQSGYQLSPTLAASAKFGIGLCEEELGNFDEAKKIYSEIVSNPDLQAAPAASQANLRLAVMDDYKKEVAFQPAPVTPPIIKFQPDSNQPPTFLIGQANTTPVQTPAVQQVNLPGEMNKP